uniref:Uncharacterized protein n=1 Tax=Glossina palpalis gambiensis TaxID=67801 RepID=A0A1B0C4I6_9MUSC
MVTNKKLVFTFFQLESVKTYNMYAQELYTCLLTVLMGISGFHILNGHVVYMCRGSSSCTICCTYRALAECKRKIDLPFGLTETLTKSSRFSSVTSKHSSANEGELTRSGQLSIVALFGMVGEFNDVRITAMPSLPAVTTILNSTERAMQVISSVCRTNTVGPDHCKLYANNAIIITPRNDVESITFGTLHNARTRSRMKNLAAIIGEFNLKGNSLLRTVGIIPGCSLSKFEVFVVVVNEYKLLSDLREFVRKYFSFPAEIKERAELPELRRKRLRCILCDSGECFKNDADDDDMRKVLDPLPPLSFIGLAIRVILVQRLNFSRHFATSSGLTCPERLNFLNPSDANQNSDAVEQPKVVGRLPSL